MPAPLVDNLADVQRALDELYDREPAFRVGVATVTFAASNASAVLTVAHGLGRIPTAIVASSMGGVARGLVETYPSSYTDRTFDVQVLDPFTARSGAHLVGWVAFA